MKKIVLPAISMIAILFSVYFTKYLEIKHKFKYYDWFMANCRLDLDFLQYFNKFGKFPENLEDCEEPWKSTILSKIPSDIFDEYARKLRYKTFRYRGKIAGFLIYSVGVDGDDDNGGQLYTDKNFFNIFKDGDLVLDYGGHESILDSILEKKYRIEITIDDNLKKYDFWHPVYEAVGDTVGIEE